VSKAIASLDARLARAEEYAAYSDGTAQLLIDSAGLVSQAAFATL
jgi:hypothetical protein